MWSNKRIHGTHERPGWVSVIDLSMRVGWMSIRMRNNKFWWKVKSGSFLALRVWFSSHRASSGGSPASYSWECSYSESTSASDIASSNCRERSTERLQEAHQVQSSEYCSSNHLFIITTFAAYSERLAHLIVHIIRLTMFTTYSI